MKCTRYNAATTSISYAHPLKPTHQPGITTNICKTKPTYQKSLCQSIVVLTINKLGTRNKREKCGNEPAKVGFFRQAEFPRSTSRAKAGYYPSTPHSSSLDTLLAEGSVVVPIESLLVGRESDDTWGCSWISNHQAETQAPSPSKSLNTYSLGGQVQLGHTYHGSNKSSAMSI